MQIVTMKCPKCGHLQEERQDCVRCGIVFAKYYAFHAPEKGGSPEVQEAAPVPGPVPADVLASEVAELRQRLREAMRRLGDVEFERAERNVLRGELKALEHRSAELIEALTGRLQALEARDPGTEIERLREELWDRELGPFLDRLERLEDGLGRLGSFVAPGSPEEPGRDLAARLARIEDAMASLSSALTEQVRGPDPDLTRQIDEVRAAVAAAAARCDQVGELGHACVSLQSEVAAVRRDLDALGRRLSEDAVRLGRLESDQALARADAQDAGRKIESLQAALGAQAQEAEARRLAAEEVGALREALAVLEAKFAGELAASARRFETLAADVALLREGARDFGLRLQPLEEKLDREDPQSRIERDVRAIKEGLAQIRDLIQVLASPAASGNPAV